MASKYFVWRRNHVHYQKRGMGEPLLLVHNIYPGASHEEFQFNIDELARCHTVYALDLLGFGDSDAPRQKYTAQLYIDLIKDFSRDVIAQPAHVMAAGLSCAYVAQSASDEPALFDRIIFLCPRSEPTGLDIPRWAAPIRHFMLTAAGMGQSYYSTVTGEASLNEYLRNCFYNPKAVTRDHIERLHYNSGRENSIQAYAGLMVGYLDWPLLDSLPKLQQPLLLIWGRQARPTPVEHSVRLVALARRCNLRIVENAGAWVHDEQSAQVNRLATQFLAGEMPESARAATA